MKTMLVEISAGVWLRPERVTAIVVHHNAPDNPYVVVRLHKSPNSLIWEYESLAEAHKYASMLATKVNKALTDDVV